VSEESHGSTPEEYKKIASGNTWSAEENFIINGLPAIMLRDFNGSSDRVYIWNKGLVYEIINTEPDISSQNEIFEGIYKTFTPL
jgi:hypothetical protein